MTAPALPSLQQKGLALVPALVEILRRSGAEKDRRAEAFQTIDAAFAVGITSEAYMAGLIKAFVHASLRDGAVGEELEQRLKIFAAGDYTVAGGVRRPKREGPQDLNFDMHEADRLAMLRLIEHALGEHGDQEAAARLARSTMIFARGKKTQQTDAEALCVLRDSLQERGVNPFAGKRVLQFGGCGDELTPENFPLLSLFAEYRDYTPVSDYAPFADNPNLISLKNPGSFAQLPHKYDAIIASNIFCQGSVITHKHAPDYGGGYFFDLLALFANNLRDGGKVIVTNVQDDPMVMGGRGGFAGLRRERPDAPVRNGGQWYRDGNGVYEFTRDYALRADIPYTQEEKEYDQMAANRKITNPQAPPLPSYQEKLAARRGGASGAHKGP